MQPDAQDALRSDARIFSAVARAATDGVVVAIPDGTIVEFNEVAEKIFGRTRAAVIGKKIIDVLVPATLGDAHRAAVARHRTRMANTSAAMRFTTIAQHSDGSTFPVDVSLCVTRSESGSELAIAFVRDRITQPLLPLLPTRLPQRLPEQVADLLASAPCIVFTFDREGIVEVSVGGGLSRMGLGQSELVGRSIFSLRPHRVDLQRIFERAVAGERFRALVDLDGQTWDTQFQPIVDDTGDTAGSLGISIDVTAQIVSERALRLLAETDTVTGLSSRRHTESSIAAVLAADEPLTLMLVDLDDFKDINDTHGHAVGDVVLARIGARLRKAVPEATILGRLGGDELVIGVATSDLSGVAPLANRVLDTIARPMRVDTPDELPITLDISVTASIGIAVAPEDGDTMSVLMTRADSAMYAAKRSGRASHRFYRADADRASRRLQVSTKLRSAITAGSIDVEFQPVMQLSDNSIIGFEALARWHDADLGPVDPDEFIALAEHSPLIDDLFDLVLNKAVEAAALWNVRRLDAPGPHVLKSHGGDLISVGINIAARQLRDPLLPTRVVRAAEARGLPPSCIVLELTETALMDDPSRTATVLGVLRDVGVKVLIDDYGVGYSNMARLGDLSAAGILDGIKIDRTFVADLPADRAKTLLRMFLTMTDSLGVNAIAEGIESLEQLHSLRTLGCRFGQGWHFAKPMHPDQAVALILG